MPSQKMSPAPYLATGFRNVDGSGDTPACTRCLDLLSDLPFFGEIKQESFRIIFRARPKIVLDAGCGAGNDICRLATVIPKGRIIGFDASAGLLATAAERISHCRERSDLVRGDLLNLPFESRTFSAIRIDRVLQHIHNPARVIEELVRVLEPGGTLVAFDNDWDTLSIAMGDMEASAKLTRFWSDSFASGRIGRDLSRIFRNTGLSGVTVEEKTLTLTDLAIAEKVFDIPGMLDRMKSARCLTERSAARVRADLTRTFEEGRFTSGYTGYLAWGKKPE
ncbi:MAG: methyltransferase domain-containing protein [Methanoregula sp.]|jgi:SAM-dependent methyltransferase